MIRRRLFVSSNLVRLFSSSASRRVPVTIARGDGIGPEITDAAMRVLTAAGARIDPQYVTIGEKLFLDGHSSGIDDSAWDTIMKNRYFLKGPITTPQGKGYKSLNVSIRKTLSLFANVRPVIALDPFVATAHPKMNLVIIRENEEDLYAGIEHRQTHQVTQCLKLITAPGCERISRYGFEYARYNKRKNVTVMIKDNIMKLTDGLFHHVFKQVSQEYPDLHHDSMIIDIGAARVASQPEKFDVIVLPNLYGDILSDIAAEISGSVGLGASSNVGENYFMAEAIHGSAPLIAGQNIANPSGILLASVMMLVDMGQGDVAERIHNAWLTTIEHGIHTVDIATDRSTKTVGTKEFADAVIERLGTRPSILPPVSYETGDRLQSMNTTLTKGIGLPQEKKELVGVDVFFQWNGSPDELGSALERLSADSSLRCSLITNRGVKVWPEGKSSTFCSDHYRCRFKSVAAAKKKTATELERVISHQDIIQLLGRFEGASMDFIKTENLYEFDGKPGYSLGQGE